MCFLVVFAVFESLNKGDTPRSPFVARGGLRRRAFTAASFRCDSSCRVPRAHRTAAFLVFAGTVSTITFLKRPVRLPLCGHVEAPNAAAGTPMIAIIVNRMPRDTFCVSWLQCSVAVCCAGPVQMRVQRPLKLNVKQCTRFSSCPRSRSHNVT